MNINYYQTFIHVAPDCPATHGIEPPLRGEKPTVARIQYELLAHHPYVYTQEEILFEVHARHKAIPAAELEKRGEELRVEFFSKSHACLRASPLPKKYGWGIHFDAVGKAALYPVDSEEYRRFVESGARGDNGLTILPAMRNARA